MNKKRLKEVFEFFPNAKFITQDMGINGLISIHSKIPEMIKTWSKVDHWESDIDSQSNIDRKMLQIDWEHRKTWKQRCVSREEAMGE